MKKIISVLYFVLIVILIILLTNISLSKLQQKNKRNEIVSIIPPLQIESLDGDLLQLNILTSHKPTVLILYHSECDHCGYEAQSISLNINSFEEAQIVFISEEPIKSIQEFGRTYSLLERENIILGHVDSDHIIQIFQNFTYPTIFIYNRDGKLLKEFIGETKVSAIFDVLKITIDEGLK